jgi:hypothetical protein
MMTIIYLFVAWMILALVSALAVGVMFFAIPILIIYLFKKYFNYLFKNKREFFKCLK